MDRGDAVALLGRAPVVHVATTSPCGEPVARTLHAVVVELDGQPAIAFHGAPTGEKTLAVGREAVLWAEEIVAAIPSWFVDEERACPATTLYRSAQVHGRLEEVEDPRHKAVVLAALMAKHQPEGRHAPIDADHPLYRKAIASILVAKVALERVDGKAKLGQNRTPVERARILELLWRRGLTADPQAIEAIRRACPDTPTPAFLRAPEGATLCCAPDPSDAPAAVALLSDTYWNDDVGPECLHRAHLESCAWVGARDERGRLVATARATSDGAKRAWIYDVCVAPEWRGRGLGEALVRLLVDHPRVRDVRWVWLSTRDAHAFYARLGFVAADALPPGRYTSTSMRLERQRQPPSGGASGS